MLANAPLSSGVGDHLIIVPGGEAASAAIPTAALQSHDAFREWATSPAFPEQVVVSYLDGEVCIDMSPENLETHNLLKAEVSTVLRQIVRQRKLGTFYFDGCLLTFDQPRLSTVPDAIFVSRERFKSQQIKRVASRSNPSTHAELKGAPDWVLEVVSASSEDKDKLALRKAYFEAGVREYWIIDALGDDADFEMLVAGDKEYDRVHPVDGWLASPTFGCSFRLTEESDEDGFLDWLLEVQ